VSESSDELHDLTDAESDMTHGPVYQPQEQRDKGGGHVTEESEKTERASVGLNGTISSVCI